MAIWNYGSINADWFYSVPHLPAPGETLAATGLSSGLGGKGANQSVAAARAGAEVHHVGSVGEDGLWARDRLRDYGVRVERIRVADVPTAHAIINVAADGENAIVIFSGANATATPEFLGEALGDAKPGDLLLLQNETTLQAEAARIGAEAGLRVVYSAAPFDVEAVRSVLPYLSMLLLNKLEAEQLEAALETTLARIAVPDIVVTRGGDGADWLNTQTGRAVTVPAHQVRVVDTTGAGDTFAGYLAAGIDAGLDMETAMRRAGAAAALKVGRHGTADAIPPLDEVLAFLG